MPNQGIGIVWGVGSTAVGAGSLIVTGEDLKTEADKVETRNSAGNIASVYYYNHRSTLGVKCYPYGDSADAVALPVIGATITIVAADDAAIDGDWIVDSAGKSRKVDGIAEFDLGLVRFESITPS